MRGILIQEQHENWKFWNDKFVPLYDNIIFNLLARCSHDAVCNDRKKDLINLCISSDLQILNGRAFDNYSGKETSFQYNRKNVVDYCFISNSFAWSVLYFNVTEHLPIFLVNFFFKLFVPSLDQCTYMPHQYFWNKYSYFLLLFSSLYICNNREVKQNVHCHILTTMLIQCKAL